MFLFNLSLAEFAALMTAISSFVVLLYLLDRSRRRQVVPTLRFWQDSEIPSQRKHRRKIQQPWSLILQLLGIALLLLAVGQLRIGSPDRSSRDHVLLMDASAWMGARNPNGRLLMEDARQQATRYVRALPSVDRVMVVRADSMATPLTGFEGNKNRLETVIKQIQPGASALNLGQGLDFAQQALKLEGKRAGEIVFAGVARMPQEAFTEFPPVPANLRLLTVASDLENCGLRKVSLRRSLKDPEVWEVYVTVRNYGTRSRQLPLTVSYGGAPMGARRLVVAPGTEVSATVEFRTKAAGWMEARIESNDALPADDIATLELPAEKSLRVVVYSNEPELLRPLLAATRRVETVFRRPAEYKPDPGAGLVIFDRFKPTGTVEPNAIWIEPPTQTSPVPVRQQKTDAVVRWRSDQFLAAGLRTRDARVESTQVFAAAPNDIPVAEVDGAPVILARPGKQKMAIFGFHPMKSSMRFELATPLVFANILKWMAPDIFLRVELQAGSVGTVTAPIESAVDAASVRVDSEQGMALPFTVRERVLRFFSGAPGIVRAHLGDREMVYSLSLPEVGEVKWDVPKTVRTGFAGVGGIESAARDIWQWLALAGMLVLLAEWLIFGRSSPLNDPSKLLRFPWRGGASRPERKAS